MTREIKLSQGYIAIVDDEDFAMISMLDWYATPREHTVYARTKTKPFQGSGLYMHQLIMLSVDGEKIDHRDFNGLNNTRDNLRHCTSVQSSAHTRGNQTKLSGYKGVYFKTGSNRKKPWCARIIVGGREISLGTYETKEEAATARDIAALQYQGDFAFINNAVKLESL